MAEKAEYDYYATVTIEKDGFMEEIFSIRDPEIHATRLHALKQGDALVLGKQGKLIVRKLDYIETPWTTNGKEVIYANLDVNVVRA